MSVINSMLRNLDERQVGTASKASLPGEVIALPRAKRRGPRGGVVLLSLSAGVLALAVVYFWQRPQPVHVPRPLTIDAGDMASQQPVSVMSEASSALGQAAAAAQPTPASRVQEAEAQAAAVTIAPTSAVAVPAKVAVEKNTGSSLVLATWLEHPEGLPSARSASKTARVPVIAGAPSPRATVTPPQQSLPVAPPTVAVVSPTVGNASIRLEQSAQTASERNLAEVQHAADLQRRGALPEAEASLRSVLDNDKGMVSARLALFSLLSRQQRNDEARKLLKEGVDISPTHVQLVLPYARLLAARGEWSAANDALVPAADALAQDAEYRALYAAVLQRLGRFPQSSAEYRAALRLAPTAGAWWVGLGLSLEGEGKQVEARSAYMQARSSALGPDLGQFVDNKLARLGPAD